MELMKVLNYEIDKELIHVLCNPRIFIRLYVSFLAGSVRLGDEFFLDGNDGLVFTIDRIKAIDNGILDVRIICFNSGDKGVDLEKLIGAKVWKKK